MGCIGSRTTATATTASTASTASTATSRLSDEVQIPAEASASQSDICWSLRPSKLQVEHSSAVVCSLLLAVQTSSGVCPCCTAFILPTHARRVLHSAISWMGPVSPAQEVGRIRAGNSMQVLILNHGQMEFMFQT